MTQSLASEEAAVLAGLGAHLDSRESLTRLMGFLSSNSSLNISEINKPATGFSLTHHGLNFGVERSSVQPVTTYPSNLNLQTLESLQSQFRGVQQSSTQHSLLGLSINQEFDMLVREIQQKQQSPHINSNFRTNQLCFPESSDTKDKEDIFQPMQQLIQILKTQFGTSSEIQRVEHILMVLKTQSNMSSIEFHQMIGALQLELQKLTTHLDKPAAQKQIHSLFQTDYLNGTNQISRTGQQQFLGPSDLQGVNQMEKEMYKTRFDLTENQQLNNLQLTSSVENQEIDQLCSILQQIYEVIKTDSSISATELSQVGQILEQFEKQLYSQQTELQQTNVQTKLLHTESVHQQSLAERTMSISELNQIVIVLEQLLHVLEAQSNTVSSKSHLLSQITELLQHVSKTLPATTTTKATDRLKQALLRLPPTLQSLPCASQIEVQQLANVVQELFKSHFSNNLFSNQSPIQDIPVVRELSDTSEQQGSHSPKSFDMLPSFWD